MDDVYLLGLEAAFSHPREAPSASFRIRIKLTSKEAERRLTRIRRRFLSMKGTIVNRCQLLEGDSRLQKTLFQADEELEIACLALRSYRLGERHYIADPVLLIEEAMDEAISLLLRAQRYERRRRGAWALLHAQAKGLDDRIRWTFGVLIQMRQDMHDEVSPGYFRRGKSTSWQDWVAGWVCFLGRRSTTSKSGGGKPKQEHHEREHVFTPTKRKDQQCRCLQYR